MTYETGGLAPGLEELVAVARYGQITEAAHVLGLPQPTLSRSIARLASSVGVPLIQRSGRGIKLTRHGRMLTAHAERALTEITAGLRAVRAEADPDAGTVVLGFLNSMGPTLIPQLLRGFKQIKPRVTVQLVQHGSDELLTQLADGYLDLCIAAPLLHLIPPDLEVHTLSIEPLALVLAQDHPLAQHPRVTLDQLRTEPLITMQPGYGLRDLTDHLLKTTTSAPHYVFESQDIPTAVGLVQAGLGAAILPATHAPRGTVAVPIDSPEAVRTITLSRPNTRPRTGPAANLHHHITQAAPDLLHAPARNPIRRPPVD